jgi:hypothetical protein
MSYENYLSVCEKKFIKDVFVDFSLTFIVLTSCFSQQKGLMYHKTAILGESKKNFILQKKQMNIYQCYQLSIFTLPSSQHYSLISKCYNHHHF